jgi:hypothetical protein
MKFRKNAGDVSNAQNKIQLFPILLINFIGTYSDPDNPIPVDGSAFPRIYNVVPMNDKLALNATPNWTNPIFLMATFMIQS